jgi:hypothetical protein
MEAGVIYLMVENLVGIADKWEAAPEAASSGAIYNDNNITQDSPNHPGWQLDGTIQTAGERGI